MTDNTPTPPAQENIPEPTGCVVCGRPSDNFTVCIDCGVDMFLADYRDPMEYCKDTNPERFGMILNWYNQQNKNECLNK